MGLHHYCDTATPSAVGTQQPFHSDHLDLNSPQICRMQLFPRTRFGEFQSVVPLRPEATFVGGTDQIRRKTSAIQVMRLIENDTEMLAPVQPDQR